jgi:ribosome maturation factor RimP
MTPKDTGVASVEARVTELIEPTVESLGLELVRVHFKGRVLQIMAEHADGTMTIEDCTKLSRAISPLLDAADPIAEGYSLEVSSPGIDRPLTRSKDFVNWSGREAKIELKAPLDGRKRFRGLLKGLKDGAVLLEIQTTDRMETIALPLVQVAEAKLVLTDDLLKRAAVTPIDETEFDEVEVEE